MMRVVIAAATLIACGTIAHAQQASDGPGNKAVNEKGTTVPGAPVAGANSFTEAQAKSRLESNGFAQVSGLAKDSSGVWRGTATKGGQRMNVAVDFQGNVTTN